MLKLALAHLRQSWRCPSFVSFESWIYICGIHMFLLSSCFVDCISWLLVCSVTGCRSCCIICFSPFTNLLTPCIRGWAGTGILALPSHCFTCWVTSWHWCSCWHQLLDGIGVVRCSATSPSHCICLLQPTGGGEGGGIGPRLYNNNIQLKLSSTFLACLIPVLFRIFQNLQLIHKKRKATFEVQVELQWSETSFKGP